MPITIGSNIASIAAQRQLGRTGSELSSVFERLSSGQRINRASDDAAGLAISDSLNARARVFNQGVKNLNDGLSVLNIADSAVEQLSGIVTRLTELAEQAANGSYSLNQRKALDTEAQALSDEFFRIKQSTSFNGLTLFDGSVQNFRLQGGYGDEGGIAEGLGGAIGTGTFGTGTTYAGGSGILDMITADFNGDGNADLAVASNSGGSVGVFLGTGNGSFGSPTSYAVGALMNAVTAGDFNGDGILYLAGKYGSNTLGRILIGRGDGSFTVGATFNGTRDGRAIGSADFNNDGRADLVTAGVDNFLQVILGRGDGTFGSPRTFGSSTSELDLTIADFNNDGVVDVATVDSSRMYVHLGNGDGTLRSPISYSATGASGISNGDFNGDGVEDLVVVNGALSVYLGSGDGTFSNAVSYAAGGANSVTVGDFNGDGITDLAAGRSGIGAFYRLLGMGNGTFGTAVSVPAGGVNPRAVTAGDFNRDGVLDLASALASSVSIVLGNTQDGIAPLLPFSLRTMADARQALSQFRQKGEQLTLQRGELGAFQSRVGVAVNVLQVSAENFKSAESRIRDADVAEESSRSIRLSILQQAGSAVLAQANQQPALAITLLAR